MRHNFDNLKDMKFESEISFSMKLPLKCKSKIKILSRTKDQDLSCKTKQNKINCSE
jgi:hypothetical protein